MKDYTKLWDSDLSQHMPTSTKGINGLWYNSRPEPYYGLRYRLRGAWDVLWSNADALYWEIDQHR